MAARLFWTNWRNPESWTAKQRDPLGFGDPVPDAVSCSIRWAGSGWQQKPVPNVTTLIGTAINITYFNSNFGGGAGSVHDQIGQHVVAQGWDLFDQVRASDGATVQRRVVNYDEGPTGTQTYLINLMKPGAGRWWAQKLVDLGGAWCDGLHVDYWTPPDIWIEPGYSLPDNAGPTYNTNKAYMRAMARTIHHYRALRTALGRSSIIIGQQYHNMNATTDMRELDSRYVEQDPKRWSDAASVTPWQSYHQPQFDDFASLHGSGKENMVVEMATRGGANNNKAPTNSAYRTEVLNFANTNNCWVSWGRDDFAGFEWPL